ncbi:MAG: hypothetical protein ACPGUD_12155 [Parashewanella sp.]
MAAEANSCVPIIQPSSGATGTDEVATSSSHVSTLSIPSKTYPYQQKYQAQTSSSFTTLFSFMTSQSSKPDAKRELSKEVRAFKQQLEEGKKQSAQRLSDLLKKRGIVQQQVIEVFIGYINQDENWKNLIHFKQGDLLNIMKVEPKHCETILYYLLYHEGSDFALLLKQLLDYVKTNPNQNKAYRAPLNALTKRFDVQCEKTCKPKPVYEAVELSSQELFQLNQVCPRFVKLLFLQGYPDNNEGEILYSFLFNGSFIFDSNMEKVLGILYRSEVVFLAKGGMDAVVVEALTNYMQPPQAPVLYTQTSTSFLPDIEVAEVMMHPVSSISGIAATLLLATRREKVNPAPKESGQSSSKAKETIQVVEKEPDHSSEKIKNAALAISFLRLEGTHTANIETLFSTCCKVIQQSVVYHSRGNDFEVLELDSELTSQSHLICQDETIELQLAALAEAIMLLLAVYRQATTGANKVRLPKACEQQLLQDLRALFALATPDVFWGLDKQAKQADVTLPEFEKQQSMKLVQSPHELLIAKQPSHKVIESIKDYRLFYSEPDIVHIAIRSDKRTAMIIIDLFNLSPEALLQVARHHAQLRRPISQRLSIKDINEIEALAGICELDEELATEFLTHNHKQQLNICVSLRAKVAANWPVLALRLWSEVEGLDVTSLSETEQQQLIAGVKYLSLTRKNVKKILSWMHKYDSQSLQLFAEINCFLLCLYPDIVTENRLLNALNCENNAVKEQVILQHTELVTSLLHSRKESVKIPQTTCLMVHVPELFTEEQLASKRFELALCRRQDAKYLLHSSGTSLNLTERQRLFHRWPELNPQEQSIFESIESVKAELASDEVSPSRLLHIFSRFPSLLNSDRFKQYQEQLWQLTEGERLYLCSCSYAIQAVFLQHDVITVEQALDTIIDHYSNQAGYATTGALYNVMQKLSFPFCRDLTPDTLDKLITSFCNAEVHRAYQWLTDDFAWIIRGLSGKHWTQLALTDPKYAALLISTSGYYKKLAPEQLADILKRYDKLALKVAQAPNSDLFAMVPKNTLVWVSFCSSSDSELFGLIRQYYQNNRLTKITSEQIERESTTNACLMAFLKVAESSMYSQKMAQISKRVIYLAGDNPATKSTPKQQAVAANSSSTTSHILVQPDFPIDIRLDADFEKHDQNLWLKQVKVENSQLKSGEAHSMSIEFAHFATKHDNPMQFSHQITEPKKWELLPIKMIESQALGSQLCNSLAQIATFRESQGTQLDMETLMTLLREQEVIILEDYPYAMTLCLKTRKLDKGKNGQEQVEDVYLFNCYMGTWRWQQIGQDEQKFKLGLEKAIISIFQRWENKNIDRVKVCELLRLRSRVSYMEPHEVTLTRLPARSVFSL